MKHSSQKTVLITGALGKVGSRIIPFLKDSYSLRLTDLRNGEVAGIPVVALDLLDEEKTLEVFAGADAIVHLAIADYTGVDDDSPQSVQAPYRKRMLDVNVHGVYHVFEAARILKIPKVVYMSSLTVLIGRRPNDYHIDQPPAPSNFYACTKLFGESVAEVYQRQYGVRSHVLRLGQPYPTGIEKEKMWIKKPESAAIFSTFADIARAVTASLNAEEPPFGIYNVVSRSRHVYVDYAQGEEIGFVPQDYPEDIVID